MNDQNQNPQVSGSVSYGPIPLIVGVTGHRNLRPSDRPRLEELVLDILKDLGRSHPSTPIYLLSPLAEGADRLTAWVALRSRFRLISPLPMPRSLYEADFRAETSRKEFATLLGQAKQWFELPVVAGATVDEIRRPGAARDQQYAQVGAWVVAHSNLLVALWDGQFTAHVGGTSVVVRYKLDGIPELYGPRRHPLDPAQTGPVYHVVTPRDDQPAPEGALGAPRKLYPGKNTSSDIQERAFKRICHHIDDFNRDALEFHRNRQTSVERSKEQLFPANETLRVSSAMQSLRDVFGVADAMAAQLKRCTLRTLWGLFALAFVGAIGVCIYSHCIQHNAFLWTYLLAFGAAWAWYGFARRGEWQNKHQDYRALAEGLRIQFFWRLAGLADNVADEYLTKQKSELNWIRDALRACQVPLAAEKEVVPSKTIHLVVRQWIQQEHDFYSKALDRNQQSLHAIHGLTLGLLLLSLAVVLVQALSAPEHALIFSAATLPIAFGLLAGYAEKRAYKEHIHLYSHMRTLFGNALTLITEKLAANDWPACQNLLRELGREALTENADWLLLHRNRPVETA